MTAVLVPILWDLRESGIDIINPLQKSVDGIDYAAIKKEYGNEISFWGAGVDTQRVFDIGKPRNKYVTMCARISR